MPNIIEFPENLKIADLQKRYTREDLIGVTNDLIDAILEMVRDVPDAFCTFVPDDPLANDPYAASSEEEHIAWNLAHVIVHITASSEERFSHGSMLARGTQIKGRNRCEVPWQHVTTTAQIVQRLEESRRICLAFLDTWPDEPYMNNCYDHKPYLEIYGLLDPIGMTLLGLKHEVEHLPQIAEIVRQAEAACVAC